MKHTGTFHKIQMINSTFFNDFSSYASQFVCFQKEGVKGRVQVGTAWWFLDQQDGMRQNLETLMQVGLIAQSVGMLTDSRSFLAYPRHEYYRRLLCQMLGNLVESGQYPVEELDTLGKIVEDICYNNAKEYFGF